MISLTAIIFGTVGMATYQFLKVPPKESDILTVINDVNRALDWISDDGTMAQYFAGANPRLSIWGIFYRTTYTNGTAQYNTIIYKHDSENGWLIREEWVGGEYEPVSLSHPVAFYIDDYDDVTFVLQAGNLVEATVKATVDSLDGQVTEERTRYIHLNAQPFTYGYAVAAAASAAEVSPDPSIDIHEIGVTIQGDVRSNGDIAIRGTNHTITGEAYLSGDWIVNSPLEHNLPDETFVDPFAAIWPLDEDDFLPYTFTFESDVILDNEAEVWEDDGITLKTGIYWTDGEMSLGRSGASGVVTLIGNQVFIDVGNSNLMAFAHGVLLYGTRDTFPYSVAIDASPVKDSIWSGILYAPHGKVTLAGTRVTLFGAVAAQVFDVSSVEGELVGELLIVFQ